MYIYIYIYIYIFLTPLDEVLFFNTVHAPSSSSSPPSPHPPPPRLGLGDLFARALCPWAHHQPVQP